MKQYLLSVHNVDGVAPPPAEVMERMYKDVNTVNDELQAAGAWVFAGGLHPASTATVVRVADGERLTTAGWIITTARNRAIDRLRREASRDDKHAQAQLLHACGEPPEEEGAVRDDRLRLIFTCCHPALAPAAQVALTLRLLGGLSTAEIARAFVVPEATMAQRLVLAKGKIRAAAIPYHFPSAADSPT